MARGTGRAGPSPGRIVVVFSGRADLGWLRLLRPGFRHCFAVIDCAGTWVLVDPLAHRTEVAVLAAAPGWDPAAAFAAAGLTAVATAARPVPRRMALPEPFTCVAAVKRLVGLRSWRVWTPWQLYRALNGPLPE